MSVLGSTVAVAMGKLLQALFARQEWTQAAGGLQAARTGLPGQRRSNSGAGSAAPRLGRSGCCSWRSGDLIQVKRDPAFERKLLSRLLRCKLGAHAWLATSDVISFAELFI